MAGPGLGEGREWGFHGDGVSLWEYGPSWRRQWNRLHSSVTVPDATEPCPEQGWRWSLFLGVFYHTLNFKSHFIRPTSERHKSPASRTEEKCDLWQGTLQRHRCCTKATKETAARVRSVHTENRRIRNHSQGGAPEGGSSQPLESKDGRVVGRAREFCKSVRKPNTQKGPSKGTNPRKGGWDTGHQWDANDTQDALQAASGTQFLCS